VAIDIKAFGQAGLDPVDQQFLQLVGRCLRALQQIGAVAHHLAAHDFMDPGVIDIQLAQFVRQAVGIATSREVGRRALQHGDMRAAISQRRDQGGGRGTRADHRHLLAAEIEIVWPVLRVDNLPLELGETWPVRRVAV